MKIKILSLITGVLLSLSASSQSLNSITPSSGYVGETLNVTISGTNMNYSQWSGTTYYPYDFRK